MKTVVFANGDVGVSGLRALLRRGIEVSLVVTREQGDLVPVLEFCSGKGIEAESSPSMAPADAGGLVSGSEMVFALDFPEVVSREMAEAAGDGFFVAHPAIKPEFFGRDSVPWTIIKGERKTGVTLFQYQLDGSARVMGANSIWIGKDDATARLYKKLADATLPLLEEASLLGGHQEGAEDFAINPDATLGPVDEGSSFIDWKASSWDAYNLVRALTRPLLGASSSLGEEKVKIWWAVPDDSAPCLLTSGEFCAESGKVYVGAKFGNLRLEEIEMGGKTLKGAAVAEVLEPKWPVKFT